ncbi:MAG TPA: oligosaccharide flippase family protein [Steroidobacteraceae bacterium]|nr:oligosaccharide flippase family protein [Steroidobacteraceae bacterium]
MSTREDTRAAARPGGLRKNIAALYIVQIANLALPLLSVPYLTRVLGVDSYGLLALAGALIVYFAAFTDFGFGATATRAAAAARGDRRQLGKLVAGVTLARLGLLGISVLVLIVLVASIPRFTEYAEIYAASAVSLLGTALFPGWLLQGLEEMRTLASATVLGRAVCVLLLFVFVRGPDDVAVAAFIQSLALLLSLALVAKPVLARVPMRYWRLDRQQIPALLSDSKNAFVSSGAITMYTSAITLVLGLTSTAAAVGAFSAASKIAVAFASILWAPISQGLYPRIAALVANRNSRATEQLLSRVLRGLLPLAAVFTVGLWLVCEPLVRIVLGNGMEGAVPVLKALAGLPALLVLSNFFGVLVLYAHGEFAAVSRLQIGAALISLLWLVPFTVFGAAEGAAWSALLTESLITIGFIQLCRTRGLLRWARTS